MWNNNQNQMKNTSMFLYFISSFEGASYKQLGDTAIIFYTFLELHTALLEKIFLSQIFIC